MTILLMIAMGSMDYLKTEIVRTCLIDKVKVCDMMQDDDAILCKINANVECTKEKR